MTGFFVAATVVVLLQYVRVRERRLLVLLAMFTLLAIAHSRTDGHAARPYHLAAGTAGLVLVVMITPRHHPPAH
jgi:hypothetical protein